LYLDRKGKVQTVHYRLPEAKAAKGQSDATGDGSQSDDMAVVSKSRPEVTQNDLDMIGDFRTDALHEALARAPVEDDMLMALLVLAYAGGLNVRIDSGANGADSNVMPPACLQKTVGCRSTWTRSGLRPALP
jgi:ParB family chromosome partitioning protein